jgi:predicted transcriptional regulator
MATVTTVRLPDEVDADLNAYCTALGAVKNRVMVLALQAFLRESRERQVLEQLRNELDAREVDA